MYAWWSFLKPDPQAPEPPTSQWVKHPSGRVITFKTPTDGNRFMPAANGFEVRKYDGDEPTIDWREAFNL